MPLLFMQIKNERENLVISLYNSGCKYFQSRRGYTSRHACKSERQSAHGVGGRTPSFHRRPCADWSYPSTF